MGLFRRLFLFWKRKEIEKVPPKQEERRSFFLYIVRTPEILTYFRREKGISRKNLELVLVDDPEHPAWQIMQIAELLMTDLNLLYIVTERPETFEELAEQAMEEHGLLIVVIPGSGEGPMPGNLVLDIRNWERHLDIISAVSYNTVIM